MTAEAWVALVVFFGVLSFVRPLLGVAGVVLGLPSYRLQTTIVGIPATALEAAILGTVVGWVARVVLDTLRRRMRLRDRVERLRGLTGPMLFFLGLTVVGWTVSTLVSIDSRASLGAFKAWLIEPLIVGVILLAELRTDRDRMFIERSLLMSLLWVSIAGLVQVVAFPGTAEDGRLSSVFAPVANYYAMFAVPLIVAAVGFAAVGKHRRLAAFSAALGIAALFLSFSYGGFLGFGVGLLTLAASVVSARYRLRAVAGILLTGVGLFLLLLPSRHFQEKLNFTTRSSSLVRAQIWRTAVEIGKQHPRVGIGPGTFEKAYREVAPTLYHPPLEWLVAKPHNLYLNLWVETGVLGLIGTLGAILALIIRALRANREAAIYGAALIAILAHGLVDTTMFKNDLAVLTAVVAVLGLSVLAWPLNRPINN